jgi:D-psicose/D-tagatose/L-ribulose 3-epimerase
VRTLRATSAAPRENSARYIRGAIDAAAELGSRTLSGPLFASVGRAWQQTADERERDLERLVEALTPLAAHAADAGVVLGLEPLNRFETSFVNIAGQAIEIVDRVGSPGLGVLLDTFHMNLEEKSIGDAIRATGSRLSHFHACENDRGAPGSGHVPWDEVADALHAIGYDGPVVIESFTDQVVTIAAAAAVWRPVATSQDALAADGGAFLRGLLL